MSRRIIGPFNRVEGDLEVQLQIEDGRVQEAWVVSPLYRGFEQMLHGRDPMDALVYVPRICGICSVSQSVAAATALAQAQGVVMPRNGQLASNLILACENVADHLTHFYLFFMPDFARKVYRSELWYGIAQERFQATRGSCLSQVLKARSEFLHLQGILAGKWPHSLALQPGGTSRAIEAQEQMRLRLILRRFRRFLEQVLFGDDLEAIMRIDSIQALRQWQGATDPGTSDFRRFLHISDQLKLQTLGRGCDRFMSYGAYPLDGERCLGQGVWDGGETQTLNQELIREDLSHGWMQRQKQPMHPFNGVTSPVAGAEGGYTWCKAPRLDGQVMEVGALARQLIDGQSLITDLIRESGGNVRNRVIARLLEIARVVLAMEQWVDGFEIKAPFYQPSKIPDEGQGIGLVEAARGSLGHWLVIKKGRILNYQIIAPTTWNFSPRDCQEVPGALEQALVNAPVREGETEPVAVQHIVRSFDPCMVCTVH